MDTLSHRPRAARPAQRRRRLPLLLPLVLLLPLALLGPLACAPVPAGQPGASPAAGRSGPDYGDLDPTKPTPVPPGLFGTPNPFASSHPATSTISFPEDGSQPPIQATYVVGLVQKIDGLVRVSCQASGKDAKGTTMQFSFEAWAAAVPEAPGTWDIKKAPGPAAGEARLTHYRGAGTGWIAPRGVVQLTKIERGADVVRWDFLVEAPMQPLGTDEQGRRPPSSGASPKGAPASGSPSAAPTGGAPAAVKPSGPPTTASAAPPAPVAAPSALAPFRLLQVDTEFFVRWSGTFFTTPEAGR